MKRSRTTNRDESGRRTLSGPQELALLALLGGSTIEGAAESASVARQTVSGWLNGDPVFRAALNRERSAARDVALGGLLALAGKAVAALSATLADGEPRDRLKAAEVVLKACGLGGEAVPGPTSPEMLEMQAEADFLGVQAALAAAIRGSSGAGLAGLTAMELTNDAELVEGRLEVRRKLDAVNPSMDRVRAVLRKELSAEDLTPAEEDVLRRILTAERERRRAAKAAADEEPTLQAEERRSDGL